MVQQALSRIRSSNYLTKETTPLRGHSRKDSLDVYYAGKISLNDTTSQYRYAKPLKKRTGGGTPKFSECSINNKEEKVSFHIDQNLM